MRYTINMEIDINDYKDDRHKEHHLRSKLLPLSQMPLEIILTPFHANDTI